MESKVISDYLIKLLSKNQREDNREVLDYRRIRLEDGPIKRANGSCKVILGGTEVIVGVKLDVGEPFPDSQDEGVLICNAELSPIANPEFESGPPGIDAIELARVTDRAVRESGCLDFFKLCISPGEKVWMVFIDIYPINADGNLFDAAVLGAMRALKNARLPKYDKKEDRVLYEELTGEGLPVKKIPILCTFGKLDSTIFLDPTYREEGVLSARLSIATVEEGNLCAMQKGGAGSFTKEEVLKMIDIATRKGKELRKLVK